MSLIAIKQYMMQTKLATLSTLSTYFKIEPEQLRCMLNIWVCKGKMRKLSNTKCADCMQCATSTTEIYEWVT